MSVCYMYPVLSEYVKDYQAAAFQPLGLRLRILRCSCTPQRVCIRFIRIFVKVPVHINTVHRTHLL